jgi:hypothetical protein
VTASLFGINHVGRIRIAFALALFAATIPAGAETRFAQTAPPVPPQSAKAVEDDNWDWVKDTGNVGLIQSYLDRYPTGAYASDAQARIATLKALGACMPSQAAAGPNALSCEVQNAVDTAHAFAMQAREMTDPARLAQPPAEAAAAKADAGVAGYKAEPVYASATNLAVIGRYRGHVMAGSDTPQGDGVADWVSGGRYEGQWHDGEPDGAGVDVYPPFEITRAGVWRNGNLLLGVITNGTKIVSLERAGQFDTDGLNLLNGYGFERKADGTSRIGNWHLGVLNGYGATFDARGNLVEQGLYFHGALQATSGSQ